MFQPAVVLLFTLNSVLLCHARITKDYDRPSGNNLEAEDGDLDKEIGYGYSRKSKYNKIVITTYLKPEEVSSSYSSYVIHPLDNKPCGYNEAEDKPLPEAEEDSAKMASSLKLYPIVVEEIEQVNEPNENENKFTQGLQKSDELINDNDDQGKSSYSSYREWFFEGQPKQEKVLDEDTRELFRKWFLKEEPKSTASEYWKSFKNQFDTFYEDEFKQFFDDDDNEKRFDKYDEEDKENDKKWYVEEPKEYQYEDKNDDTGETWQRHYMQGPKYDVLRNYHFNRYFDGYEGWH